MKDVTGPCDFKVGPGRRFRSDELKSGELLTIGIGMILTVDRKHNFSCHFVSVCMVFFILRAIFLPENQPPVGDFPCY